MLRALLLERHLTHFQTAIYTILAYFMFSISDTSAKFLMQEGYDRSVVLVITSLPSCVILTSFMIYRHGIARALYTQYKALHALRAAFLVCVTFFVFMALQKLKLADFYGITFSAPFIVTIGAAIVFKEKVSITEILVILFGFAGTIVIAQPSYDDFNIGYLYAFIAALCMAGAALTIRKIGHEESPYLFVIFANLGIIIANIIPAFYAGLPAVITLHDIAIFTLYCAAIPTAILTISAVFARAPSVAAVAPFQYTQILWGTTLGYFIFDNIPDQHTVIGSAMVIGSGLYIIFHHKRKSKRDIEASAK